MMTRLKNVPIALFVYNRPAHLRRTVEALARNTMARACEVWVFSDGPRDASACGAVEDVRDYVSCLENTGWFHSVRVRFADENRGLARSIISGVSQVIEARGRVIVLEDDLVTSPDFVEFMVACLEFYSGVPTIGSISGYSPLTDFPPGYPHDVYLIPRNCSLGWATWKDTWLNVDWDVSDFEELKMDRQAWRDFNSCGSDRFDRLRRQMEHDIDSWSIRFGYSLFRRGMLTVYPAASRVRNIGGDGSGVHGGPGAIYNEDPLTAPAPFELSMPAVDPAIMGAVKRVYSGTLLSRMARALRCNGWGFIPDTVKRLGFLA